MAVAACEPAKPISRDRESLWFADDPQQLAYEHERAAPGVGTRRKSLPREEAAIVARALLGECARCGEAEQRAIIGVIFNRLISRAYGATLTDVVLYHRGATWAFSAFDPARARWANVWEDGLEKTAHFARAYWLVQDQWQRGAGHGFVNYFHAAAMKPAGTVPRWAIGKATVTIGSATFIKP